MRNPASAVAGAEIRAHLGRQGRTQTWLSQQTGIDGPGLSRRIRGERAFTLDELTRIAVALDVPIGDLLQRPKAGAA